MQSIKLKSCLGVIRENELNLNFFKVSRSRKKDLYNRIRIVFLVEFIKKRQLGKLFVYDKFCKSKILSWLLFKKIKFYFQMLN